MAQLYDLNIAQAADAIRTGEITSVDLSTALLDLIDELEPSLHAWVTIDREEVLGAAHRRDQQASEGGVLGPLHGVPIGLKDIYYTIGMKTTACSKVLADFVPGYDATSVVRLKQAGAIVLGKAVTTEFATSDPSPTINPWNGLPAHQEGQAAAPRWPWLLGCVPAPWAPKRRAQRAGRPPTTASLG